MKENTKLILKIIICLVLIIVFTIIGYKGYTSFKNDTSTYKIEYKPTGKTDYKVYLIDNPYFEQPYVESGNSYVSNLIDYISVDFDYSLIYGEKLSGEYEYTITATILANKVNESRGNGDYWTKEYSLESGTETFTDTNVFSLSKNVKIDYQEYNELLTKFQKDVGLSVNGTLKVEMTIKSTASKENIEGEVIEESTITLEIPLTQSSVDINITKTEDSTSKTANLTQNEDKKIKRIIYLIISLACLILNILVIIFIIIEIKNYNKRKTAYEKELNKILSTYNGIIVNANEIKDLSSYNIITVNSFDELLDAHSEVRMPINYIEKKRPKESTFILLSDNIAWVYKLSPKGKRK